MTEFLEIAEGIEIPISLATRKAAVIAMSGAGKSYTMRKITESVFKTGRIAGAYIDPLGVAYGLRFAPDGKAPGLAIPIIGGGRGDVPIVATSGPVVARALVEGNAFAIIDLARLEDEEQWEFMRGFASSLTRLLEESPRPFWMAIDEADIFCPETPARGQVACQRAVRHYCRRARNYGGGYLVSTQSTSVIDKKVVGQSDLIIAMRITSPTDQKPVIEWLKAGLGEPEAKRIVRTMAKLDQGDGWFYSPQWLRVTEQHHILPCETFDSSRTPEVGEVIETRGKGASIDMDALRAHFEEATSEAEAEGELTPVRDVDELRARIEELEAQLASRVVETEIREVPVFKDADLDEISAEASKLVDVGEAIAEVGRSINEKITEALLSRAAAADVGKQVVAPKSAPASPVQFGKVPDGELSRGARGMLVAIARRHPMRMTRDMLSTLSGRSLKSSSFAPHVRELLAGGYIEETSDGLLRATRRGLDAVGVAESTPMTSAELLAMWTTKLPPGAGKMLAALARLYPRGVGRDELAVESGMSPTSSGVGAAIRVLRNNRLATEDGGELRASDTLFDRGRS